MLSKLLQCKCIAFYIAATSHVNSFVVFSCSAAIFCADIVIVVVVIETLQFICVHTASIFVRL